MSTNPILDELHAVRAKLLSEAGDDLHRIVAEAREQTLASGRPIAEPTRGPERPTSPPLATDFGAEQLPNTSVNCNNK
ncbi:hypothetical protein NA78x_002077 [Anatilimnocola sp. NA78]|uniref:hypothetical protein n=1 Tax=Anatilimnocola sp. NA78 TaxID=3415683 RepID=UPI003CE44FDD